MENLELQVFDVSPYLPKTSNKRGPLTEETKQKLRKPKSEEFKQLLREHHARRRAEQEQFSKTITDEIPTFTTAAPEVIERTIPGWISFLKGEVPHVPTVNSDPPKRRGRPQIHNLPPPPPGVRVNKISDAVPDCNPFNKPACEHLIKELQLVGIGTVEQRVKYIADINHLPYHTVREAVNRVI